MRPARWEYGSPEGGRGAGGKVAALGTEAILARLGELGVETSEEAFRVAAQGRTVAWEVADGWLGGLRRRLGKEGQDFLGLAACELWKRWLGERPSVEMLDDWMQEGYGRMMVVDAVGACERWWRVWEVLRERFGPEMRTAEAAEAVFGGTQMLFNWLQDFVLELQNAAVREPRFGQMGAGLVREILERFPDESEHSRLMYRGDHGVLLDLGGESEEAERELRALIAEHPDLTVGYAELAAVFERRAKRENDPEGRARALAILEEARARPVRDGEDYDLEGRIAFLREHLEGGAAGTRHEAEE